MLKTTLICAAMLLALLLPAAPAMATQDTLCLPTSGTVSGLTIVTDVNAALKAIVTSHSGSSAPANDCSGAPIAGQVWLDSSGSQPVWKIYDGAAWEVLGTVNASSGQWQPPIGGGATSLASAATTDLWSVPQSAITITGTTTITKLVTSGGTGTVKFIAFAGALTLTQNATQLILPTGANITTAAGDRAAVLSLGGGNAAILSYQRASGAPLFNPVVVGDTGTGGSPGIVPAAPAGSAAVGKLLGADGTFSGNTVPVGASFPYAGLTAPGGYLMEYGQAVARTGTYSDLWAVLHVSATVTVTIASPAVVTWTGHPLAIGSPVSLATTGALPTGLSAATTYYVIAAGYSTNSFEVSATVGGAAINTSGSQSGTHTATYAPYGAGDFSTTFNIPDMRGRVVAAADNMGGTSANRLTKPNTVGSIDGDILGNTGGQEAHAQVLGELASHQHTIVESLGGRFGANHYTGGSDNAAWASGDSIWGGSTPTFTTDAAGGGVAANVVQPTLILNYIIRY